MNTVASMDRLRAYVLGRGDQAAAEIALAYLEQTYPKMAVVCSALRDTFVMEEYDGENTRERAARRAYNKIVDRLSNTPI
ncbi:hypothetical protein [Paraburkholderia sp.]|uniref:hypothetical protein n=1 Tax=Paraburkholderia sp. TaxID=1926495 RepID=UPI002AFDE258|nr:hypothetical protein [Paraburkholderia sp.]